MCCRCTRHNSCSTYTDGHYVGESSSHLSSNAIAVCQLWTRARILPLATVNLRVAHYVAPLLRFLFLHRQAVSIQRNLDPRFQVIKRIDAWFNFDFWVSKIRLRGRWKSRCPFGLLPSSEIQVWWPDWHLHFGPLNFGNNLTPKDDTYAHWESAFSIAKNCVFMFCSLQVHIHAHFY